MFACFWSAGRLVKDSDIKKFNIETSIEASEEARLNRWALQQVYSINEGGLK